MIDTRQRLELPSGGTAVYYSLPALEKARGGGRLSRLPVSLRILLESVLRHRDGRRIRDEDVEALAGWEPGAGAPTCNGIIQFASPTNAGMIAPKIMIRPCIVVIELKNAGSSSCSPGLKSSARISIAIAPAMNHIVHERTRYIVPMSLWFVAYNQRRQPCGWCVAATDASVRAPAVVVMAVNSSAWDSKAVNRVGRDSLRAK